MQEPWFRKQTWSWYVELPGGKQHPLGKHPSDSAPVKGKKGWNPPEEIRNEWHRVMREGGHVPADRDPLMVTLLDDFLEHATRTVKAETQDWYRIFLQDFVTAFPALKASDVTETHVHRWLAIKRKRPWGDSTRRSAITILKRALNWAVTTKRLKENPIASMAKPPAQRRETLLTPEQRADILAMYPAGDPFHDFLTGMQESGARPGEIMRLTAADVNLKALSATLWEHKSRGKTGRSRVIYYTPKLGKLLRRLIKKHPFGPLFRNADGNAWNRQAINCRFRRKKNRKTDPIAKEVVAYLWRHGWATDALENGVPVATVAELLGHESTAIVTSNYSHLSDRKDYLRRAAEQATKRNGA